MKPLISIVLPTYNGEMYIQESIDSIIKQTFREWELIIVDDCSTDKTSEIIEEYALGDSRIKIIHNLENKKLPKALNIGFEHSAGDFLTWTSDDNYYLPDALKKMYDYLCIYRDIFLVCADMEMIDSDGHMTGRFGYHNQTEMFYNNCVGACFLYRRQVFEQIGGYDADMFLVEDYDYWLRILKNYGAIGHIEEILYVYRNHENSLTATKREQVIKKLSCLRRKNLDWILDNLKDDRRFIWQIYHEFLEAKDDMCDIEKKITAFLPELEIDLSIEDREKKVIIFGAGVYGKKAADYLRERVAYFVDSDKSKVGTYKEGIKIISKEELLDIYSDYNILISVSSEKIYEILHFLYINGIRECCTYQNLIKN